jgi:hypothetical protein
LNIYCIYCKRFQYCPILSNTVQYSDMTRIYSCSLLSSPSSYYYYLFAAVTAVASSLAAATATGPARYAIGLGSSCPRASGRAGRRAREGSRDRPYSRGTSSATEPAGPSSEGGPGATLRRPSLHHSDRDSDAPRAGVRGVCGDARGGQGRIACREGRHLPAAAPRLRCGGRLPAAAAKRV